MTLFMLDTDTVSFALRGLGQVASRLQSHKRSELCLSAITVAELRFGADKRKSRRIHRVIDAFLAGIDVLAFDAAAAAKFGVVGAALATSGLPIGQMDTLIAAHALSVTATLVTNNEKHFSKVAGLKIENWT
ncbi:MAG TPA: PIN domain-containing protein [Polyangiaceae bacterium]